MEFECCICLNDLDVRGALECSEKDCSARTCSNCLRDLIDYYIKDGVLPSCPGKDCSGYHPVTSLKVSHVVPMAKAYRNYYSKSHKDNIEFLINKPRIIEKIRESRLTFINTELPKAISFIAQISFKNQLNTIRSQQKLMAQKEYKSKRKCLNHACIGCLTEKGSTLECGACEQQFCLRCELRYKEGHICDTDILSSINLISDMIHCPKCNNAIEKSTGCDHMRCTVCNTHFDYKTGDLERFDLHVADDRTIVTNKKSIIILLKDTIEKREEKDEIAGLLGSFEQLNVKKPSIDKLLSTISSVTEETIKKPEVAITILKAYELYIKSIKRYKSYINAYNEIVVNIDKLKLSDIKDITSKF